MSKMGRKDKILSLAFGSPLPALWTTPVDLRSSPNEAFPHGINGEAFRIDGKEHDYVVVGGCE
jgi:hypothetical protein